MVYQRKWVLSIVLCLALLIAVYPAFAQGVYQSGIYVGAAYGAKGEIKVAVELSENAIENVWVIENHDSPFISEKAAELVSEGIVENQSLRVDTLTGATATSWGVITAAQNAIMQAAEDIAHLTVMPEKKEIVQGETEEYDVVVVGSGPAGLSAALSAATNLELEAKDSGLSVLVVESQGYAGGAMRFSGGTVSAYNGTPLNEALDHSVDNETVVQNWMDAAIEGLPNEAIMRKAIELGPQVLNALMDRGLYVSIDDAVLRSVASKRIDGGVMEYVIAAVKDPTNGNFSGKNGYSENGGAPWLAESFINLVQDAGIEIRLNTTAEQLIMEDDVCVGVQVTGPDKAYEIRAKKVILATGHSDTRYDTAKQFYPNLEGTVWASNPGCHSSAQKWVAELGGELDMGNPGIMLGYDSILGFYGEESYLYNKNPGIWVDVNGNRFFDESGARKAGMILELDKNYAYILIDSANSSVKYIPTLMNHHYAWTGNTVDELAAQIGVPAEALNATITAYNEAAASGADDASFGTPNASMAPLLQAPFYAVKVNPVSMAEGVSVKVDEYCNVMLSAEKKVENLYCCGAALGTQISKNGSGANLLSSMTTGAYAGDCARNAIVAE